MINEKQSAIQFARPLWVGFLCFGGLVLALTGSTSNAVGIALGPFAGAAARSWQSCCAENAWAIAPYAFASLGVGLAVRWLWRPEGRVLVLVRDACWWLAALSWFGAALLSYLHALE